MSFITDIVNTATSLIGQTMDNFLFDAEGKVNGNPAFSNVDRLTEAYLTPFSQGGFASKKVTESKTTSPSGVGLDAVRYKGVAKYKVHIPELMPTLKFDEGIWCANGITTCTTEQCPSPETGAMDGIGNSVGDVVGNAVGGPTGSSIGRQAGEKVGTNMAGGPGGPKIYKYEYSELPIGSKVTIQFLDNDINSARIVSILPFNPEQTDEQFKEGV